LDTFISFQQCPAAFVRYSRAHDEVPEVLCRDYGWQPVLPVVRHCARRFQLGADADEY
jgi:hypothetical protein